MHAHYLTFHCPPTFRSLCVYMTVWSVSKSLSLRHSLDMRMNRDLNYFLSEFNTLFSTDHLLEVNSLLEEAGQI